MSETLELYRFIPLSEPSRSPSQLRASTSESNGPTLQDVDRFMLSPLLKPSRFQRPSLIPRPLARSTLLAACHCTKFHTVRAFQSPSSPVNNNASRALSKHSSKPPPCETLWTSPQWLKQIILKKERRGSCPSSLSIDSRSILVTSCSSLGFIP